ncbi:MAG: hypothetical protein OXC27_09400 [Caldilineaceae bacterium]|nr:hypothetical protein [Caldilineaceae bacterium]
MTAEMWFDSAICVLCSVFGGLIVGTFSEFVPMRPSFARKWVMLFIWALLIGAAALGVLTYYWGVNGFWGGLLGVPFFYFVCWMIYESGKERDERERSGQEVVFLGFSWQPAAFLIPNSTNAI